MSQVRTIRRILDDGNTITQRSALMDHGIMALPRRIADLKEKGYPIASVMCSNPTTGQRFAMYYKAQKLTSFDGIDDGAIYKMVDVKQHPFHHGIDVKDGTRMKVLKIKPSYPNSMATVEMMTADGRVIEQVFTERRLTGGSFALIRMEGTEL